MNKPLTYEILYDLSHPVTQTLLYIHSMETFIYKDLKKAYLQKDITKVKTLGPYAVMEGILYESLSKKLKNDEELQKKYFGKPLFRGILIKKEKCDEQFLENVFSTG